MIKTIDVLRQNIRHLRTQKGWTQARLADELNVSPDTVQKWETLHIKPGMEEVAKLADIFGITIDGLAKLNYNSKSFEYVKTIPASELRQHKSDSDHMVYVSPGLMGGATLHRFINAAGVEYSAIYVGMDERKSATRERENVIIYDWNLDWR